ncbi:tRNA (cytidine(34)-2'-O)-methyltransferase [Granulosicoccus sp. 3-233]|uniref:tRNA (cytidine(34)-2'-O)-methyltransferase n=1 Tax=Granulosicoccus sp. 3-233 TaxID=3417969 RepID=UPI003D346253
MTVHSQPLHIVLYEPEIPPNTGNLIRLCANTGAGLHLVEPLGFSLEEKALRRAGLDYHETARVQVHATLSDCLAVLGKGRESLRVFAVSTRGSVAYHQPDYQPGDVLLFGPESRGLPEAVLEGPEVTARVRIPMQADSRSLNLSNAVAIITYEVLRQLDFPALL